jgi:hypothetical protein
VSSEAGAGAALGVVFEEAEALFAPGAFYVDSIRLSVTGAAQYDVPSEAPKA